MRTQDLREKTDAGKASRGYPELIPAILYTSDCVLRGKVGCEAMEPLADILNRNSGTPISGSNDAFLPLFEVDAVFADGNREEMQSTYVRKENVLFAAQSKVQMVRRGKGVKSGAYPDEMGEEVPVVVYMPSHILIGNLKPDTWRTLADDLACRQRFLSLSGVMVSSSSVEVQTRYALAAVNSGRILHITRLPREGDLMRGQLTVDGILSELLGLKGSSAAKRPATK